VTFVGDGGSGEAVGDAERSPEGWAVDSDGLHREFRFPDFASAWRFMGLVAAEAERVDHHPDWSNSYGLVSITLISHDVGRVTQRDIRLARWIGDLFDSVTVARR